jgi:FMNH2-dependent dimethyl sulfone monooxygenase
MGRGGSHDGVRNITQSHSPEEYAARRHCFSGKVIGGYPLDGTPDRVADELATASEAGMRGIAVWFINSF